MEDYRLREFAEVGAFAQAARPLLLQDEAAHCLPLGLMNTLSRGDWSEPYLAVVERHGEPSLVAVQTPPHNLILSLTSDQGALAPLVASLDRSRRSIPGVHGPAPVADAFAELWSGASGAAAEPTVDLRVFRLERVDPPPPVAGEPRLASAEDRSLLVEWMASFQNEALPQQHFDAATVTDRWLASPEREIMLWVKGGEPVAMAGAGSPTPSGIRISAVYTPPEHRGHGYASGLVAHLSQRQLDSGRRFCFLFTDLSNPISNRIYRRLGYQPVCDVHEYRFG